MKWLRLAQFYRLHFGVIGVAIVSVLIHFGRFLVYLFAEDLAVK